MMNEFAAGQQLLSGEFVLPSGWCLPTHQLPQRSVDTYATDMQVPYTVSASSKVLRCVYDVPALPQQQQLPDSHQLAATLWALQLPVGPTNIFC